MISRQYEQGGDAIRMDEPVETESFEPTIVRLDPQAAERLFREAGEEALEASGVQVQLHQTE